MERIPLTPAEAMKICRYEILGGLIDEFCFRPNPAGTSCSGGRCSATDRQSGHPGYPRPPRGPP